MNSLGIEPAPPIDAGLAYWGGSAGLGSPSVDRLSGYASIGLEDETDDLSGEVFRTPGVAMDEVERLKAVLETAHNSFVSMDDHGLVVFWNAQAERTFGYSGEEARGKTVAELIIPERYRERHWEGFARFLQTGRGTIVGQRVELSACRRDGGEIAVEITISALREADGRWRFHAFIQDISQRKSMEAEREELLLRLEAMAKTDHLTGVYNRRAWDEELARELARARRDGQQFTVVLIDLDRFKVFNDRHGHPAGDELLKETALAWTRELRETDLLARLGGDEFAVLLPGCPPIDSQIVIDRLRRSCRPGNTVSIGTATWDGRESAEPLLRRADDALYAMKREGTYPPVIGTSPGSVDTAG